MRRWPCSNRCTSALAGSRPCRSCWPPRPRGRALLAGPPSEFCTAPLALSCPVHDNGTPADARAWLLKLVLAARYSPGPTLLMTSHLQLDVRSHGHRRRYPGGELPAAAWRSRTLIEAAAGCREQGGIQLAANPNLLLLRRINMTPRRVTPQPRPSCPINLVRRGLPSRLPKSDTIFAMPGGSARWLPPSSG